VRQWRLRTPGSLGPKGCFCCCSIYVFVVVVVFVNIVVVIIFVLLLVCVIEGEAVKAEDPWILGSIGLFLLL